MLGLSKAAIVKTEQPHTHTATPKDRRKREEDGYSGRSLLISFMPLYGPQFIRLVRYKEFNISTCLKLHRCNEGTKQTGPVLVHNTIVYNVRQRANVKANMHCRTDG